MANFEIADKLTRGNEGYYANNPSDIGGETYCGIARKFHPNWRGWQLIDKVKNSMTKQPPYGTSAYLNWVSHLNKELRLIPAVEAHVRDFYRAEFWDANKCGEVTSQDVANWLYDHLVNAGARGAKWIQEAAGVEPDGSIGPKSLAAINASDPKELLNKARGIARDFRLSRVQQDPSQKQFLAGWLKRDGFTDSEIKEIIA